jgi:hypothetical protein
VGEEIVNKQKESGNNQNTLNTNGNGGGMNVYIKEDG